MHTRNLKIFLSVFLVLAILLKMQPVSVFAEAKDVMVAQWDFTSDPDSSTPRTLTDIIATGGVNASSGYLSTSMGNPTGGYTENSKSIYING